MKKVTVAIAAYNSEKNIKQLLMSITGQLHKNWSLEKIIVHSDCSQDKTVQIIKDLGLKKVAVIDNKIRKGFAGSVKSLLNKSSSDITILLNDDIKIQDSQFIEKIVNVFSLQKNVGLVTARPIPLKPRTFVEKSVIVSINAYENTLYGTGNYQNIFTCDGKVMAIDRKFKNSLSFPKKLEEVGNVDSYIYLSCIKANFKYFHEKEAFVYFRCPSTIADWIRWTSRNNADKMILVSNFGSIALREFKFPNERQLTINKLIQAVLHPIESILAATVGAYSLHKAKSHRDWLTSTWELVSSSKAIEN